MTNDYILSPIALESQLEKMKSYVHFTKKARMIAFLSHTGYYRCSRYGKFLISHTTDIGMMPSQDLLFNLYTFDSKLRELFLHYCQLAEIQFKTYLSDSLSLKLNDSTFYLNSQYYTPSRSERDKVKKQSNVRFFYTFYNDIRNFSSDLIRNSQKYPELKEYRKGGTKEVSFLPCWVSFAYMDLGKIINIYAYLRGDLRNYVLKYGYTKEHYSKSSAKKFDTWLEALRNLRNVCAHHNLLIGKTSSIVLSEFSDENILLSNTDLFSRLYALKKILPSKLHSKLKHDLQILIKQSHIDIFTLRIFPYDWEERFDKISVF